MNITNIGILTINLPRKGVNRAAYATEVRNGKLQFTKATDKAKKEEDKKTAKLLVPINNIAFAANGQAPGIFLKWISSIVSDVLSVKNPKEGIHYNVDDYRDLRSQLLTK